MNAIPGMIQPPEATGLTNHASRRTFLKGAGLAGAAGLAGVAGLTGPFLARTSAQASTLTKINFGVNAPFPWETVAQGAVVPAGFTWHDFFPGAIAVRHYLNDPHVGQHVTSSTGQETGGILSSGADVQSLMNWAAYDGGWPVERDASNTIIPTNPVVSIYPDPKVLLDPGHPDYQGLIGGLNAFILDGMKKAKANTFYIPQLNTWHEAGNLYSADEWSRYWPKPVFFTAAAGLPKETIAIGQPGHVQNLGAAQIMRSVHVEMQGLCRTAAKNNPSLPPVAYGCIIYGNLDLMANDDPNKQDYNFIPDAPFILDWYGIDVYYEDDTKFSSNPVRTGGNLDAAALNNYMNDYANIAGNRVGSQPTISVTECNANAGDANARPDFLKNLAAWLSVDNGVNGIGTVTMLTYFHGKPTDTPANHSVPWNPQYSPPPTSSPSTVEGPYSPDQGTIDALRYIQNNLGLPV